MSRNKKMWDLEAEKVVTTAEISDPPKMTAEVKLLFIVKIR